MLILFQILAGVLLASAVSSTSARAATLFFFDDGPGFVDHAYFGTPQLGTLTFPLFDPSQGVLNSVTLSVSGALQTTITLDCFDFLGCRVNAPNQAGEVTREVAIGVQSSLIPLNDVLVGSNPVLTLGVTATVPHTAFFSSFTSPLLLDVQVVDFDLPPELFNAAGGGSFSLTCRGVGSGSSIGTFTDSISFFQNQSSTACGASILYDYTPAAELPEAGSIAMLTLGLIALGTIRRKHGQAGAIHQKKD